MMQAALGRLAACTVRTQPPMSSLRIRKRLPSEASAEIRRPAVVHQSKDLEPFDDETPSAKVIADGPSTHLTGGGTVRTDVEQLRNSGCGCEELEGVSVGILE